ncbi:amino acid adenylation domain-containing protein, partial [Methanobrevibacter sp.]|uniref:non-ribosomal peptide synthetase family protein n=1 Tax=Methanobrevibacter sp. TaxID=66852 RepID=UPI00388D0143
FESMEVDNESENVDELISELSIDIIQKGNSYILYLQYSSKYSEDVMNRFAESYKSILSQIICVDKLGEINYVSDSDLELLDTYNQTEHALKYNDILDAFNDNLMKYPDNKLVLYNDAVYSYAESVFIADKIAKKLADLGVEFQDNVAFLVNRSELYLFIVLAILSMGAVYVPLDTNLPDERIDFILEDTDSKVLIVSDETYEYAQNMDNNHVLLNVSDIVRKETGTLSSLPVNYGDLACILYTSGTTGVPKGVKITRKSLLNVAEWYVDEYGFGKDDVYGMFSSIGFDVASFNITVVMLAGACLAIVPEDCKSDMAKLNEYYIQHGVNHAWITTSVGKLFMNSVDITSLDILICGGEKLGEFESPKDYTLIDVCGPTEAFEHVYSIKNSDKMDSSSIGYLNYNTKAYLLDDEFRRVPVGAVGELYLAGYQLAEGYLNRDEKTKEAFLENPFDDDEEYNVLYRTGDMGRMLPDGSFAIVGRRDSQVKVRGNRVELSEIESIIRKMDGIADVTVQTIKTHGTNEIVVYAVSDMDENLLDKSIRDYVAEHKPAYMVPSYVIKLDKIPLNVNGKVDRRALPDVDLDSLRVEYVAATNETEQIIVEAFEKVFNQEKIGIYDDFVRLGGDSITAIKITSILSKYDINVNAHIIFENKTPYQIAKFIDKDQAEYGFYLAKEGTSDQNMFILPPQGGISLVFSQLLDNLEFEGNVYLIDDFKLDLTIDEVRNTDYNMTFEKYWDAIKDIFLDGDIIAGYSLGCLYSMLIVEKLEKYRKIEKCILIDGPLDFYNDEVLEKEGELNIINQLHELGLGADELEPEDHDELIDKIVEISRVNLVWDFPAAKINDTPVIYLATTHELEGKLENIARNGEFIFIEGTDHLSVIGPDVKKIVKYFK